MRRLPDDLSRLEPRRVVLIKPSSLGDVVHALPALGALRARWPYAKLAWVVNRGLRGLLDGHPLIDEVIPFDRAAVSPSVSGLRSLGQFLAILRRRRFDLAIDLQGLFRSGLFTAATAAPVRVGLASAREGAPWFYTHRVADPSPRPHAVDRLMNIAASFGASREAPRVLPAMTDADRLWAAAALASVPRPRLILNIGARWETKRWPPEQFAQVARRAVTDRGAGLVAVGAPEDLPLVAQLTDALGGIPLLNLAGRTSLPQLAAVSAAADLFLSNDTGPLHLAAATGANVIGIYTCTKPEWTGPYGPNALALKTGIWCAGSCVKTCDRLDCMTELTADRVAAAVLDRLGPGAAIHPAA